MTILEKIISSKIKELKILKSLNTTKDLENKELFEKQTFSLKNRLELSRHGIIAEHKRKSPSKSVINDNIKLENVIKGYHKANVCGKVYEVDCVAYGRKYCGDGCFKPSALQIGDAYKCEWQCKTGAGSDGLCVENFTTFVDRTTQKIKSGVKFLLSCVFG